MSKARAFIGTSGYSYKHWRGVFYPGDLKENKWLEHYAGFLDTVELNVTFYRLPQRLAFLSWYKRTPKNFRFAVKGSRFITHVKRLKDCAGALSLFFSRVKLLKNKLGCVLWQLAPSFKADPRRLETFFKRLKKYKATRQVFEFRNETWFCEKVFKILRDEGACLCSADSPDFAKDIRITSDFVYIRRHGTGATLYGGCYSRRQLERDAKIIKEHLRKKRDVYIYFNNDARGYAVKNAMELKKFVRGQVSSSGVVS
ncbi:MAG: DUF72 domain-containing protein [Candidatus Omnitrophota bacterium]